MALGQIDNPDEVPNPVVNQMSEPPSLVHGELSNWVFRESEQLAVVGIDMEWPDNVSAKVRTKNDFYYKTYLFWRWMDSTLRRNGKVCAPGHLTVSRDENVTAYRNWFDLHIFGKEFQEWMSDAFGSASAELC